MSERDERDDRPVCEECCLTPTTRLCRRCGQRICRACAPDHHRHDYGNYLGDISATLDRCVPTRRRAQRPATKERR